MFVSVFIKQWVASIDITANEEANENVLVKLTESFTEQAGQVSCGCHAGPRACVKVES